MVHNEALNKILEFRKEGPGDRGRLLGEEVGILGSRWLLGMGRKATAASREI